MNNPSLLQLGAVAQKVTVSSTALRVETTSTQQGEVIGGTLMTSLLLNGRSYTDLLALQPGVAPQASGEYITYNQLHGDGFEFQRNTSLDARNFYSYDQINPVTNAIIPGSAIGAFRLRFDP